MTKRKPRKPLVVKTDMRQCPACLVWLKIPNEPSCWNCGVRFYKKAKSSHRKPLVEYGWWGWWCGKAGFLRPVIYSIKKPDEIPDGGETCKTCRGWVRVAIVEQVKKGRGK